MKKSIIAVAIMMMAGIAVADQSMVNSAVSGTAGSTSVIAGTNSSSSHFAVAGSYNVSTASGVADADGSRIGAVAGAATQASTQGGTFTMAGGHGAGDAGAIACQSGAASASAADQAAMQTYNRRAPAVTASAAADSSARTFTFSGAFVRNNGFAISGTQAEAQDTSVAASGTLGGFLSTAGGASIATSDTDSFGYATHGYGDFVFTGGYATSEGSYNAAAGNAHSNGNSHPH